MSSCSNQCEACKCRGASPIHDVGDVILITCELRHWKTKELIDPTTISMTIQDPDGDETTYVYGQDSQIVKEGVGSYYGQISVTKPGIWKYLWKSEGIGQA